MISIFKPKLKYKRNISSKKQNKAKQNQTKQNKTKQNKHLPNKPRSTQGCSKMFHFCLRLRKFQEAFHRPKWKSREETIVFGVQFNRFLPLCLDMFFLLFVLFRCWAFASTAGWFFLAAGKMFFGEAPKQDFHRFSRCR